MDPRESDRPPVGDAIGLEDLVDFADNPEPRCACVLLLDTSESMSLPRVPMEALGKRMGIVDGVQTYEIKGTDELLVPIKELNEGIKTFRGALESDPLASLRVETAIVTFDSSVQVVQDFATVDSLSTPDLDAKGQTSTATAVNRALDMLEDRKRTYREASVSYYRPWVVMMTDGASTDSEQEMLEAAKRVRRAEESKQLAFFSVGVEGADMEELNRMGPRRAVSLRGLAFKEFFLWLSNSMTRVSASRVDDEVNLPDISGWAEL